jgi:hypothetical protein
VNHLELINVNELVSGDLEYPKRRRVIPEGKYPKLDILLQRWKGLD